MPQSHGMSKSPTYNIWSGMKKRCYNPKSRNYPLYGAAGIQVCDRWKKSFDNFYADMGERPPGMSIERLDSKGPYAPGNCVWADRTTQNRNRSMSRWVEVDGRSMCLSEACQIYGTTIRRVHKRLKFGWDLMEALRTPPLTRWSTAARDPNDGRAASRRTQTLCASSGSAEKAP